MIKPDGVQRGLVGEIIKRFEQKGYHLAALKMVHATKEHMEKHYEDLKDKKFFPGLIQYMISGPVVCMVWQGKEVIAGGRRLLGATKPSDSAQGTIRGDFAIDVGRNICHGSDSPAGSAAEIAHWFPEGVVSWVRRAWRARGAGGRRRAAAAGVVGPVDGHGGAKRVALAVEDPPPPRVVSPLAQRPARTGGHRRLDPSPLPPSPPRSCLPRSPPAPSQTSAEHTWVYE